MPSCISPLSLKHGDERHVVPCGKCNFCLQAKRADWTFRLLQELKVSHSAFFLTLTYEDKNLPMVGNRPSLCKEHMQKFMKKLRKVNSLPLRYYSVGEYGTKTDRPHYHSIMFNMDRKGLDKLRATWGHGNVHVGEVSVASIHYVTKFHLNKHAMWEEKGEVREKPFLLLVIAVAESVLHT